MKIKCILDKARTEEYLDLKSGRAAAAMYAFEALNYARLFPIRVEDLKEINEFNELAIGIQKMQFTKMLFNCQPVPDSIVFRIEISVLVDTSWHTAGYNCRVLPD